MYQRQLLSDAQCVPVTKRTRLCDFIFTVEVTCRNEPLVAAWSGHARVCSSCPCVLHTGVLRTRTQNGSRDGQPPWFHRLLNPEPVARIFDGVFDDLRFSLLASSPCGTKSARLLLDVPLELGGAGGYNGPSAVDGLLRHAFASLDCRKSGTNCRSI